jgi:spermidine/putrescine transport system permease protein
MSLSSSSSRFQVPRSIGVLPFGLWMLFFLIIPFCFVAIDSFAQRGTYGGMVFDSLSLDNYLRAFDPIYAKIFSRSLQLAGATTLLSLFFGFPMAWLIAISKKQYRNILLLAVVVPFWTNFIVRVYAVKVLVSTEGPFQAFVRALQIPILPDSISSGPFAVMLGMVTNYLPFMVLPIWVSIDKFDFTLLEAARDLGASRLNAFRRVLLPQVLPGVMSGMTFVFTPALGEFVIPDLLGGARTMLIGNLVTEQFLKARDWPFGAALSVLLIACVLGSLSLAQLGSKMWTRNQRAHSQASKVTV